jgi:hypothetical protein
MWRGTVRMLLTHPLNATTSLAAVIRIVGADFDDFGSRDFLDSHDGIADPFSSG